MRTLAALVGAATIGLGAYAAPADNSLKPSPIVNLTIFSYSELAPNLASLFVPFLAKSGFAETKRRVSPYGRFLESNYVRPNGDVVTIRGGRGCILIDYVATQSPSPAAEPAAPDRAAEFHSHVESFLSGLPTPRPRLVDRQVEAQLISQGWHFPTCVLTSDSSGP